MISLIMRVRIKPEKATEFERLIARLAHDVYANEPDCLAFEVRRSADDPNIFVFFECFRTKAAHEAHPDMPYHKEMSQAGWECVDGEPEVEMLTPLKGAPPALRSG